jgi:hypothetical protein
MNKIILILFLVSLIQAGNVMSDNTGMNKSEIEKGKSLVNEYGCIACHTPKVETVVGLIPDPVRLLSGHSADDGDLPNIPEGLIGDKMWAGVYSKSLTAWAGPRGVSFAANLTPDKETGIGNWSKQNFISTIRLGIHTTSLARELSPAMPWRVISTLNDDELGSIYSYLMSLKPIKNKVPEHIDPKKK